MEISFRATNCTYKQNFKIVMYEQLVKNLQVEGLLTTSRGTKTLNALLAIHFAFPFQFFFFP